MIALISNVAQAQFDDFNDGNDSGWTRYDPIGAFGNMAVYTFPHGGYRIIAPGTGDPFVGGGRAGSLREDQTFSGFHVEVDLADLDTSHSQAVGLLSRIADPGLFTTDGYALTYVPSARTLDLMRVDREVLSTIASAPLPPDSDATSLRLAFTGVGPNLVGQVLEDSNLSRPLTLAAPSLRQVPEPTVVFSVAVALLLSRHRGCSQTDPMRSRSIGIGGG